MKTVTELNADILTITMKIQKDFPELSKYLIETPLRFPESDGNEISRNSLEAYYNSLVEIVKGYSNVHFKTGDLKLNVSDGSVRTADFREYPVNSSAEVADDIRKE